VSRYSLCVVSFMAPQAGWISEVPARRAISTPCRKVSRPGECRDATRPLSTRPGRGNRVHRSQISGVQPHAFLQRLPCSSKRCLDGKACTPPLRIGRGRQAIIVSRGHGAYQGALVPTNVRRDRGLDRTAGRRQEGCPKQALSRSHRRETGTAGLRLAEGKRCSRQFHSGTYSVAFGARVGGSRCWISPEVKGWANLPGLSGSDLPLPKSAIRSGKYSAHGLTTSAISSIRRKCMRRPLVARPLAVVGI